MTEMLWTVGVCGRYLEKLRKEEVSIDWAHTVLINSIRQQRMLKIMAIAGNRHFTYDNENDLVEFIASEMQKEGLDLNNEEDVDSYLSNRTRDYHIYSGVLFGLSVTFNII
ncbi:MAG: hypothetical protein WAK17_27370 [Candidatus Nitrosopolaris sp.]